MKRILTGLQPSGTLSMSAANAGARHLPLHSMRVLDARDGVLAERGMIGWTRFLDEEDSEAIRAYVGEQARKLKKEEAK